MSAGHCRRKRHVQDFDVTLNVVRLHAEDLDLILVAGNNNAQAFDEVLVKRGEERRCCDVSQTECD